MSLIVGLPVNPRMTKLQLKHYAELISLQKEIPINTGPINNLWVVTAASEKFWICTKTLAESLRHINGVRGLLVFDLGLSEESKRYLKSTSDFQVYISDSLLSLVNQDYLSNYQFKIDGLCFAPHVIADQHAVDSILWLDSGVLVNSKLERFKSILNAREMFLCDLSTKMEHIKAFNHMPFWEKSSFPFSVETLCKPLLWAGIHGYRVRSKYNSRVINLAWEMSLLNPNIVKGPKFVTAETRKTVEETHLFKSALEYAKSKQIKLASSHWNGVRHDLFLYTCLYHNFTNELLSSHGHIEDVTNGQQTIKTANAVDAIKPERLFSVDLLSNPLTEFVIHRGTLGLAGTMQTTSLQTSYIS